MASPNATADHQISYNAQNGFLIVKHACFVATITTFHIRWRFTWVPLQLTIGRERRNSDGREVARRTVFQLYCCHLIKLGKLGKVYRPDTGSTTRIRTARLRRRKGTHIHSINDHLIKQPLSQLSIQHLVILIPTRFIRTQCLPTAPLLV